MKFVTYSLGSVHQAYFLEKRDDNVDSFCLVIADFEQKAIFYIDPSCDDAERENFSERATQLGATFNRFLDHHLDDAAARGPQWRVLRRLRYMKFSIQQTDFDSGIYCFLLMYFNVHDCPAIFDHTDIISMRKQLAFWLLKEYLPI